MTVFYADTSAIVSAFLADEPDHGPLRRLLLTGTHDVLTSELTRIEFASAVVAAEKRQRIPDAEAVLVQFDEDAQSGLFDLIPLRRKMILAPARRLVINNFPLRTLDALHLAVALHDAPQLIGEPITFVTRDQRQADAAKANGLQVR